MPKMFDKGWYLALKEAFKGLATAPAKRVCRHLLSGSG
jgi:hypothetical protein